MNEALVRDGEARQLPRELQVIYDEAKRRGLVRAPIGQGLDQSSGAPASVRALMGTIRPEDQLATIQKTYPDADLYSGPNGETNIVFMDPQTGRPTLANPPGFDPGDISQHGRVAAEVVGGIAGGAAGTALAGPGPGTAAGIAASAAGTGIGAEMFGQIYDAFARKYGREDTRSFGQKAAGATANALLNAAGEPLVYGGKKAVGALAEGITSPVRNRLAGNALSGQLYKDFETAGIRPDIGAISGSRAMQRAESWAGDTLAGGPTIQRARNQTIDETGDYAYRVAQKYGAPASPETFGAAVRQAAKDSLERFNDEVYRREDAFWSAMGQDSPVAIGSTAGTLQQIEKVFEKAPSTGDLVNKSVNRIGRAIMDDAEANGGFLPARAIREIRSKIGQEIKTPGTTEWKGLDERKLKRLYASISQDLEAAADERSVQLLRGGQQGVDVKALLQEALKFEREWMSGPNATISRLANKETDESIFRYVFSTTKEGPTRLSHMRQNFKPEEWDTVAGTILESMGRATAGRQSAAGDIFSPATFLTNWNRVPVGAKKVLFGGTRYKDVLPDLDRLARVVGSLKDTAAAANVSRTAGHNMFNELVMNPISMIGGGIGGAAGGVSGGLAGAAATTGLKLGAQYGAAKLLTNKAFIRWVADGARIAQGAPHLMTRHLGRLALIAKTEPDIQEEIDQYFKALRDTVGVTQSSAQIAAQMPIDQPIPTVNIRGGKPEFGEMPSLKEQTMRQWGAGGVDTGAATRETLDRMRQGGRR